MTVKHTSKGSWTLRKVLRYEANGFISPLKEGVLRIFIVLKNLSPSAGFEHAILGSNGKHANLYTTEDDQYWLWVSLTCGIQTYFSQTLVAGS
jgi:hypothetical protein